MTMRNGIPGGRRNRRGAGLTELVLAMMIFAFIATSYAAASLRYATQMRTLSAGAARSAALHEYITRLYSVPFDSLAARADTDTTTSGELPNVRSITVTGSGASRTITLILRPTNTSIKPDTVVFTRFRAGTSSPLT